MTTATAVTRIPAPGPIAITGCGVVSTAGVGLELLRELLEWGTAPAGPDPLPADDGPAGGVDSDALAYPPVTVRPVPDIPLAAYVGRKGTRRLDRMVGFALIASRLALGSAGRADPDADKLRDHTGVTIGTSTGSVRSLAEIATDTLLQDEPYMIAPSRFPNTVLNSCAGQVAIWNSLKAVNSTVAGGALSGTSALRYAGNAIRLGHARSMLVGGIEELGPHLAWAWHRSGLLADGAALGEGCALLVAEAPDVVGDRPVLAELLGTEVGYCGPRTERVGLARGLARCVTRLLTRTGLRPEDVDVVSLGAGCQVGARRIEEQGVRLALGSMPEHPRVTDVLGETFSASGSLQAAALLARWSGGAHPAERHALVTSLGRDGNVGCFLLRRPA